jgi:hypothetical protein
LIEAASRLKAQLGQNSPSLANQNQAQSAELAHESKLSVLNLRADELPKYKKYRDLSEQFLDAKQFPHFRTLLEKARGELSSEAFFLLEEFGKSKGFSL